MTSPKRVFIVVITVLAVLPAYWWLQVVTAPATCTCFGILVGSYYTTNTGGGLLGWFSSAKQAYLSKFTTQLSTTY